MSDDNTCRTEKEEQSIAVPQVALHLTPDEADAMLSILLHVANLPDVSCEMTERLLFRVAELQRQMVRNGAISSSRMRTVRRNPVPVSV